MIIWICAQIPTLPIQITMNASVKFLLCLSLLVFGGCGSEEVVDFGDVQWQENEWRYEGKSFSGSAADYHESGEMHNL